MIAPFINFLYAGYFCIFLSYAEFISKLTLAAYIANNMDQDQTAPKGAVWSGFIMFDSMIESSLKCTWIYAADVKTATLVTWPFYIQYLHCIWWGCSFRAHLEQPHNGENHLKQPHHEENHLEQPHNGENHLKQPHHEENHFEQPYHGEII